MKKDRTDLGAASDDKGGIRADGATPRYFSRDRRNRKCGYSSSITNETKPEVKKIHDCKIGVFLRGEYQLCIRIINK